MFDRKYELERKKKSYFITNILNLKVFLKKDYSLYSTRRIWPDHLLCDTYI